MRTQPVLVGGVFLAVTSFLEQKHQILPTIMESDGIRTKNVQTMEVAWIRTYLVKKSRGKYYGDLEFYPG